MFLFRCCMRVDCGRQSESETEVSRSSHSACDYLQQSNKQIQSRLLPQPVDTSCAKQFADYSGCSHTTASCSLLTGSTQSIDYEEVLCMSVPSTREDNEPNYACVNDDVICKSPRSIGVINNNFSPDTSSCNNNVLPPVSSDDIKAVQDSGPQNGSGSDESGDVCSADSSIDNLYIAEVKYVGDIRQFQYTQTSVPPHGEDCCCTTCQSANDDVNRMADSMLSRHDSDLKCSCKSCRDFYNRMQCVTTANGSFATAAGVNTFRINHYRLTSSIAQDREDSMLASSQSSSKVSSAVCKIAEHGEFDSQNIPPAPESASVSANRSGIVFGAFSPEDVNDDNGLSSSDYELHYVFHKFIENSCLDKAFTDVSTNDDRLGPNVEPHKVIRSESGAELEHSSARSADDLEVAFFMDSAISASSPSAVSLGESCAVPASVAVSTCHHRIDVSQDTVTSATELAALSHNFVTEPSAFYAHESLSPVENGSKSFNIVCSDMETDRFANVVEASAFNTNSASPFELENMSGDLRILTSGQETDFYVDYNLTVLDDENQQTCSLSDSNNMQRNVIVQKVSDTSSLFIEFPAADNEHIFAVHSDADSRGETCTADEELAPIVDDVVVEQSLEIVIPEYITERPVFADEVSSAHTAIDVVCGHSQWPVTVDVESYIRDIVAKAVRQIADDAASASLGICNVASEDDNISRELPKQILITGSPLPRTDHQLAAEDEYDKEFDSLASRAASDMGSHLASRVIEDFSVGPTDISVLDTDVDICCSDEAICVPGIEVQDVPQVENYLISYDVHLLQQSIADDADTNVDQTLIWSSHSTCPNKSIARGDVRLQDLIWPLEHIKSENEADVVAVRELSLDLEDQLPGREDSGQAASAVTIAPTDIVEDFFTQYVLPVVSVWDNVETDTATTKHCQDGTDQLKVGQDEEDLVTAKRLDIAAHNIVEVVISDAVAETELDTTATSALIEVQCEDTVDQDEVDQDLEGLVELETTAQTIVDVIISDVSVNLMTDLTSPSVAAVDTQSLMPTRSGCLLHSPSESHHKKSVHFADMHGLQLETVQHYDQPPEPEQSLASLEEFLSKLSAAAAERRAKWTEHHPSHASSWLCNSSIYLLACFELSSSQEELLEQVRHCRVALESCSFDDLALAISGIVRVANIAFKKKMSVRYSVDHWITQTLSLIHI